MCGFASTDPPDQEVNDMWLKDRELRWRAEEEARRNAKINRDQELVARRRADLARRIRLQETDQLPIEERDYHLAHESPPLHLLIKHQQENSMPHAIVPRPLPEDISEVQNLARELQDVVAQLYNATTVTSAEAAYTMVRYYTAKMDAVLKARSEGKVN